MPEDHLITRLLAAVGRGDAAARERLWALIYDELRAIARGQLARERAGHTLQPTALVHEAYLRLMGSSADGVVERCDGGRTDAGPQHDTDGAVESDDGPPPDAESGAASSLAGNGTPAAGSPAGVFANRRHFFSAAARAMRCIRIDDARKRNRQKRGGGRGSGASVGPWVPASAGATTPGGESGRAAGTEEPAVFDQDHAEVLAVDEALTRLETEHPRLAEMVTLHYFAGLTLSETAAAMGLSARTVDNHWRYARAWLHRELSKGDTRA
jgi:RNA polymerase sigma factor (sigma-70 family)